MVAAARISKFIEPRIAEQFSAGIIIQRVDGFLIPDILRDQPDFQAIFLGQPHLRITEIPRWYEAESVGSDTASRQTVWPRPAPARRRDTPPHLSPGAGHRLNACSDACARLCNTENR